MWSRIVKISEMSHRGKDKPEFFDESFGERIGAVQGQVEIEKLANLVIERKEKLNTQDDPDRDYNYLSLANIASDTGDLIEFSPVSGTEVLSVSKVFKSGDILYARLRPYLNKVYHCIDPVAEGICSTEFNVFIPRADKINPVYLHAVMLSELFTNQASYLQTGSALPRITIEDLYEVKIPLPRREFQDECARIFESARNLRMQRLNMARREFREALMVAQKLMIGKSLDRREEQFSSYLKDGANRNEASEHSPPRDPIVSAAPTTSPRHLRKKRSRPE